MGTVLGLRHSADCLGSGAGAEADRNQWHLRTDLGRRHSDDCYGSVAGAEADRNPWHLRTDLGSRLGSGLHPRSALASRWATITAPRREPGFDERKAARSRKPARAPQQSCACAPPRQGWLSAHRWASPGTLLPPRSAVQCPSPRPELGAGGVSAGAPLSRSAEPCPLIRLELSAGGVDTTDTQPLRSAGPCPSPSSELSAGRVGAGAPPMLQPLPKLLTDNVLDDVDAMPLLPRDASAPTSRRHMRVRDNSAHEDQHARGQLYAATHPSNQQACMQFWCGASYTQPWTLVEGTTPARGPRDAPPYCELEA